MLCWCLMFNWSDCYNLHIIKLCRINLATTEPWSITEYKYTQSWDCLFRLLGSKPISLWNSRRIRCSCDFLSTSEDWHEWEVGRWRGKVGWQGRMPMKTCTTSVETVQEPYSLPLFIGHCMYSSQTFDHGKSFLYFLLSKHGICDEEETY